MPKRILIVDDDPHATQPLRRLLEASGYAVEEENESAKALLHARAFQPDFVLLDFVMPVVDGSDVAWQIASDPRLCSSKLIVLSGASPADIRFHMPPNRIPILEKPIDLEALLRLLHD